MKAIIIEEHRFGEIRKRMQRAAENVMKEDATMEQKAIQSAVWRAVNYAFVDWAAKEGASCR